MSDNKADNKTALVVSAHAADFVWRCGGAIALHQNLGYEVTICCLSFGERGESELAAWACAEEQQVGLNHVEFGLATGRCWD